MSEEMKTLEFSQTVKATPEQVYNAITNRNALQAWFGNFVESQPQENGRFYAWWAEGYYTSGVYTQLKENERCLLDFQREKLVAPMTFDGCLTADRRGRVQKAALRTANREDVKCDPLGAPPPFAYTDAATVNAAAVDGALALAQAIFGGPPVLDANLAIKADDKEKAKCQLEMLKQASKLENVVLKEIIKAKKIALKEATTNTASALGGKLVGVSPTGDTTAKASWSSWMTGKTNTPVAASTSRRSATTRSSC